MDKISSWLPPILIFFSFLIQCSWKPQQWRFLFSCESRINTNGFSTQGCSWSWFPVSHLQEHSQEPWEGTWGQGCDRKGLPEEKVGGCSGDGGVEHSGMSKHHLQQHRWSDFRHWWKQLLKGWEIHKIPVQNSLVINYFVFYFCSNRV